MLDNILHEEFMDYLALHSLCLPHTFLPVLCRSLFFCPKLGLPVRKESCSFSSEGSISDPNLSFLSDRCDNDQLHVLSPITFQWLAIR